MVNNMYLRIGTPAALQQACKIGLTRIRDTGNLYNSIHVTSLIVCLLVIAHHLAELCQTKYRTDAERAKSTLWQFYTGQLFSIISK